MESKILIPDELKNLPEPWCWSDPHRRREDLGEMEHNEKLFSDSLIALKRCLIATKKIPDPSKSPMPEGWGSILSVHVNALSQSVYKIEDLEMERVVLLMKARNAVGSPQFAESVALYWLDNILQETIGQLIRWLRDTLPEASLENLNEEFLNLARNYYYYLPDPFEFIIASAVVAEEKSLPFLKGLLEKPDVEEALKKNLRPYISMLEGEDEEIDDGDSEEEEEEEEEEDDDDDDDEKRENRDPNKREEETNEGGDKPNRKESSSEPELY